MYVKIEGLNVCLPRLCTIHSAHAFFQKVLKKFRTVHFFLLLFSLHDMVISTLYSYFYPLPSPQHGIIISGEESFVISINFYWISNCLYCLWLLCFLHYSRLHPITVLFLHIESWLTGIIVYTEVGYVE